MAKFIFKLQNILDIKLRLETQAKTEFAAAMTELDRQQERLRVLLDKRKACQDSLREASMGRLDFAEVKRINSSIKAVEELMRQQAVAVRIAQRDVDKARQVLNEAVADRKIYEKLKENAFEEFKLAMNDEEKKEIDQLVSFTYNDRNSQ